MLVHHERVHEVELVEADGSASDGADEAALQQADVVIVDVDVGKDVGEDRAQHIACIEEFFDAAGVHTLDNGLFRFWDSYGRWSWRRSPLMEMGRIILLVLGDTST